MRVDLLIAVIIVLSVWGLSQFDYEDERRELDHYCYMVQLYYQDSNVGWPDYRGIFNDQCVDDPSKIL